MRIENGTYYLTDEDDGQFRWALAGAMRKHGMISRDRVREWLDSPPPDERLYRSPRRWTDLKREDRE